MTYPDVNDLQSFIGLGASDTDEATAAIAAAVAYFEKATGRLFVVASAAAKQFAVKKHVLRQGLRLLTYRDFFGVTAVTNGDGYSFGATEYELLTIPTLDGVEVAYGLDLTEVAGNRFSTGGTGSPVTITAKWGYSENCPEDVFSAILALGAHFYRLRGGEAAGGAVAQGTGQIIAPAGLPKLVSDTIRLYHRG